MAWIESHQSLAKHKKLLRLAGLLRTDRITLIGHLHLLWWWALDNVPSDGYLGDITDFEIAIAAEWGGDPEEFVSSLVQAGFIDVFGEERYLHDWNDYAGKLLERREGDARRKRSMREAYENGTIYAVRQRDGDTCRYCGKTVNWNDRRGADGGTYDHVIPDGPATVENLVVCCRACNSKKGHRTPEQAGMILRPVLDENQVGTRSGTNSGSRSRSNSDLPTQPNLTIPKEDDDDTRARAREGELWSEFEQVFAQAFGGSPTALHFEEVDGFIADGMTLESVVEAVRIAALNKARGWSYVRRTLQNWLKDGQTSLDAIREKQKRIAPSRASPQPEPLSWIDRELAKVEAEIRELEQRKAAGGEF